MKTFLIFTAIAIVVFGFIKSNRIKVDFDADTKEGIQFFKGTFQEAHQKAKEENKPLFLDFYATWCGPCKALKRNTFSDKEVGDYFNKNFINLAVNGETPEGRVLMQKYKVRSYPTLIITDFEGNYLTKQVGYVKPRVLINLGRRIVP